jgi:hypothetical protein
MTTDIKEIIEEVDRQKRSAARYRREQKGKAHVENELLDLLTDPKEKDSDMLMRAQAMHAGLVMHENPTDPEARILLRKARLLLRRTR